MIPFDPLFKGEILLFILIAYEFFLAEKSYFLPSIFSIFCVIFKNKKRKK